jgi:N-acylglucosamine 2-epimerase
MNEKGFFEKERDYWLNGLLNDMIPFWLKYARDYENGGYYGGLRRDGSVYDPDKTSSWTMGRTVWAFSYLYNNLRQDSEWLAYLEHGLDFMKKHSLDETGHTWGALTADGRPLARATDVYHDLYTAQAFSQAAKATGEWDLLLTAKRLVLEVAKITFNPRANPYRPYLSTIKPWSSHPEHLILLETLQYLREVEPDPELDEIADMCIKNIRKYHYREDLQAVIELCGLDEPLSPWLSGWVCPGHMLELVWLMIYEGQSRENHDLIDMGLESCEWAWRWGWDAQYGGLRNDLNIFGEYCIAGHTGHLNPHGPLKMWWSVCEAIHSNLLAYCISKQEKFRERYEIARDFAFKNFADKEFGEWFGVLSPEGKLLDNGSKATDIKMSQHTLRTFYFCYRNAARMVDDLRA